MMLLFLNNSKVDKYNDQSYNQTQNLKRKKKGQRICKKIYNKKVEKMS